MSNRFRSGNDAQDHFAIDRHTDFPYALGVQSVVETPTFLTDAKAAGMDADEREADDAEAVRGLLGCTRRWAETLTKPAREEAKIARDAKIARLAAQSQNEREIARQLGVDKTTVSRALGGGKTKCSFSPHPTEPTIIYAPAGEPKSRYASSISPFAAHSHV